MDGPRESRRVNIRLPAESRSWVAALQRPSELGRSSLPTRDGNPNPKRLPELIIHPMTASRDHKDRIHAVESGPSTAPGDMHRDFEIFNPVSRCITNGLPGILVASRDMTRPQSTRQAGRCNGMGRKRTHRGNRLAAQLGIGVCRKPGTGCDNQAYKII